MLHNRSLFLLLFSHCVKEYKTFLSPSANTTISPLLILASLSLTLNSFNFSRRFLSCTCCTLVRSIATYLLAKPSIDFNRFDSFKNFLLVSLSSQTTLTILGLAPGTILPTLPKYLILFSSNPTALTISFTLSLVTNSSFVSSIPNITKLFFLLSLSSNSLTSTFISLFCAVVLLLTSSPVTAFPLTNVSLYDFLMFFISVLISSNCPSTFSDSFSSFCSLTFTKSFNSCFKAPNSLLTSIKPASKVTCFASTTTCLSSTIFISSLTLLKCICHTLQNHFTPVCLFSCFTKDLYKSSGMEQHAV